MRAHKTRALFSLTLLLSFSLVACFGGKGGGYGGGGNGGGGGVTPKLRVDFTGGPFTAFQLGASYQLFVRNQGGGATSGTVTLTDPPTGMNVTSISGPNWTCDLPTTTCSRSDSLGPGATYDPITVIGKVTVGAGGSVSATVTVMGGGAATFSGSGSISVTGGGNVSLLFGQYAFLFSGFDANGAVAVAGSINVDQNGIVTGEEDFKDPTNLLAAQSISGSCQNYPVPATGFCRLTLASNNKTYQYDFVLRANTLVARFFDNSAKDGQNTNGSGILISQQVPSSGALTSPGGFNGYFSIGFSGTDAVGGRMALEGNIFTDLNATITPGASGSQADVNDNGTVISPSGSTSNVSGNFTPKGSATVDSNGRATMQMTVGSSPPQASFTLALYILAPEVPTTNQSGRAFAIDITPASSIAPSQVLSGQFFWLGPVGPGGLTFSNSSFSGVNVFALWGLVPQMLLPQQPPLPPLIVPASSNTIIGILQPPTAQAGSVLLDANTAGTVNRGGGVATPLMGTYVLGNVASNGRAVLSVSVNPAVFTYVLYLDLPNDGAILETGGDNTVSFGFFTGQGSTSSFNNTRITGNYVVGTNTPVLATVPNGAAPITLTPTVANSGTFSVSAGAVTGNYSFDASTGRGTATASSGQFFQNSNIAFYIVTPRLIILMGADPGVTSDVIALMQF